MRQLKIKTPEEKRLEANEANVANMIFNSMMDKMKVTQLENSLGNALVEISRLKEEVGMASEIERS